MNILAKEAFPPEEYLAPAKLVEMAKEDNFDFLTYLGVNYEVFCMDEDFEPEVFKAMMKTIQIDGFNPKYFNK